MAGIQKEDTEDQTQSETENESEEASSFESSESESASDEAAASEEASNKETLTRQKTKKTEVRECRKIITKKGFAMLYAKPFCIFCVKCEQMKENGDL